MISNTAEVNQRTDSQSVSMHHNTEFKSIVNLSISTLPADVISCCDPTCSSHRAAISKFIDSLTLCVRSISIDLDGL